MALRPDVRDAVRAAADPAGTMRTSARGWTYKISLVGNWFSDPEAGLIGNLYIQEEPTHIVTWEFVALPVLAATFNAQTNEEWQLQLAEAAAILEHWHEGQTLPSGIRLSHRMPWRDVDLPTFMAAKMDATVAFHFAMAQQQVQGGLAPNPQPAASPLLTSLAERLKLRLQMLEDANHIEIARVNESGLIAVVHDAHDNDQVINAAQRLHNLRNADEHMSLLIQPDDEQWAREQTQRLILDLFAQGVEGFVAHDGDEAAREFSRIKRS